MTTTDASRTTPRRAPGPRFPHRAFAWVLLGTLALPVPALRADDMDSPDGEAPSHAPGHRPNRPVVDIGRPLTPAEEHALTSDVPLALDRVPDPRRPELLIEEGEDFLGAGKPAKRWVLPTGAVWQPALWVFGNYRSAVQEFDNSQSRVVEWANRLDLFVNAKFSGTERILLGFRPLDKGAGRFTGYQFHPDPPAGDDRFFTSTNATIQTLFFEGDIGEIFPRLDPDDSGKWDIYFSVGKQEMSIQEGILVNDFLTGVGVTTINNKWFGANSWRLTGFYAWNDINRGNNTPASMLEDRSAGLFAVTNEADFNETRMNLDLVYVNASEFNGKGLFGGLSLNQRMGGTLNSTFRVCFSSAVDGPETSLIGDGQLFLAELSWEPKKTHDVMYVNAFLANERFTSAARDTLVGGPLGNVGILFAALGLGRWGAPLSNQATEVFGAGVGRQWFLDDDRRRTLTLEVGGREDTNDSLGGALGGGVRYQQAIGQHVVLQGDAFLSDVEGRRNNAHGWRVETQVKF